MERVSCPDLGGSDIPTLSQEELQKMRQARNERVAAELSAAEAMLAHELARQEVEVVPIITPKLPQGPYFAR